MSCGIRLASCAVCMRLAYRVIDAHHCSETRIGILRALIERAAALNVLEDEICEVSLHRIFFILLYEDTALGNLFCIPGRLG